MTPLQRRKRKLKRIEIRRAVVMEALNLLHQNPVPTARFNAETVKAHAIRGMHSLNDLTRDARRAP